MKTYVFHYSCEGYSDTVEMKLSAKEVRLIKKAYRDGFTELADDDDLQEILERVLSMLDFYDPDLEQDIRIYFPEEITDEVDEEDI